jgi:hypothetical protein
MDYDKPIRRIVTTHDASGQQFSMRSSRSRGDGGESGMQQSAVN